MNQQQFDLRVKVLNEHPEWRPWYFYSPMDANKVIYPAQMDGIRRQLITVNDIPGVGINNATKAVIFEYGRTEIGNARLAVALLLQTDIDPGKDWSEKLLAEIEPPVEEVLVKEKKQKKEW